MAGRLRTLGGWKRFHAGDVVLFSALFWFAAAAVILAWRGTQTRGFSALGPWGTPLAFAGWLAAVIFTRSAWRKEAGRRGLPRGTVALGHALLSVATAAGVILLLSHDRFWLGVGLCLWIAEEGWALGLWRLSMPASRREILTGKHSQADSSSQGPLVPDQSQTVSDSDSVTHPAAATSQSVRAPNDAEEAPAAVFGESARTKGTGIGDEDDSEKDSLNVSEDDSDGIDEDGSEEEPVEAAEEGLVEEDEAEDLPPPDVSQKWTRRLLPDGSDVLSAWHRLAFAAGQSHRTVHLPFCPAYEQAPMVEAQIIEGPPGEVKVSRVWGFGARLEVRLAAPPDEPSEVLVLTVAQASPGE